MTGDNEELVLVSCGVRSGCRKGWGELRKVEGEEECRGEERMNK